MDANRIAMEHVQIKQLNDLWNGDPDFRKNFCENTERTIQENHFPDEFVKLREYFQPEKESSLYNLAQFLNNENLMSSIASDLKSRKEIYSRRSNNNAFNYWRQRKINRYRIETPDLWSKGNPHLPLAIELTDGCSLNCPFCAGAAQSLKQPVPSFFKNQDLFASVLTYITDTLQFSSLSHLLYFFTEPFDHPEFEKFYRLSHEITGTRSELTTAAWFKDPDRIRLFLSKESEERTLFRFSINSRKLFEKCLELYSPTELSKIELKLNYPEALSPPLYQSGREEVAGNSESLIGSVACVTGFLWNLHTQTIQLITPTVDLKNWPKGYIILEETSVSSLQDIKQFIPVCLNTHFNKTLNEDSFVRLSEIFQLEEEKGSWYLSNLYRKIALDKRDLKLINQIHEIKPVKEILHFFEEGRERNYIFHRLSVMWNNGILMECLDGEDKRF